MKKRLKNILCIGAVILLLSALFACSDKEKGKKNDGRSIENTSGGIVKNNGNPVFDSSEYEKVLSVYRKELAECMEIYAEDIEKLKKTKAEDNCKITFDECVFVDFPEINELEVLEGEMPSKQLKMVLGWAAFHQTEFLENWELAVKKQDLFAIDPLQ